MPRILSVFLFLVVPVIARAQAAPYPAPVEGGDDFVNPPELPMMQELIKQVRRGRFILLPITDDTRGHGTHSLPAVWGGELAKFLREIEQPR